MEQAAQAAVVSPLAALVILVLAWMSEGSEPLKPHLSAGVERLSAAGATLHLVWMSEGSVALGAGALLCLPYQLLAWSVATGASALAPRPYHLLAWLAGAEGSVLVPRPDHLLV